MARISLRQLLDHAADHGYGLPAFNMNNLAKQGLAIMAAAEETRSPVILQASRGARAYAGDVVLARMIDGLSATHPNRKASPRATMSVSSTLPSLGGLNASIRRAVSRSDMFGMLRGCLCGALYSNSVKQIWTERAERSTHFLDISVA